MGARAASSAQQGGREGGGVVCREEKTEEEPAALPGSQMRGDSSMARGRPGGQTGQGMTGTREAPQARNNLSGFLGSPRGPRADPLLESLEEITSPSPQVPA